MKLLNVLNCSLFERLSLKCLTQSQTVDLSLNLIGPRHCPVAHYTYSSLRSHDVGIKFDEASRNGIKMLFLLTLKHELIPHHTSRKVIPD